MNNAMFAELMTSIQEMDGIVKGQQGETVVAGLYDNIHAKRKRIAAGSNEKMRKKGAKGAPTAKAFKQAAKTTKKGKK
jgi:hypothetical protein